jgi:CRISPR-associated protein (TIGR02584 family)
MGRKILLAVSGLSPQVVTETLYALTQEQSPAFIPDQVILLTTQEGAERAKLGLLTGSTAQFHQFCRDYKLQGIQFNESCIRVITNSQGEPLSDIRTPQDNTDVADFICQVVRELTEEDTELHVSIAGGRKTMGYYLGYALSLFGRPQDKLSHVLVSEHYESNPDFWYPTPEHKVIYTRDDKPLDAAMAKVYLAEIPFVRLREFLPETTPIKHRGFNDTVSLMQSLASKTLRLNIEQSCIKLGSLTIKLEPSLFAFYLWLAERAKASMLPIVKPGKQEFNQQYAQEYLHYYTQVVGEFDASEGDLADTLKRGMDEDFISTKVSKIKRQIKNHIGIDGGHPLFINSTGKRGQLKYQIDWPAEKIVIE